MKRLIFKREIPSRSTPNLSWTVRIFKDDEQEQPFSWECNCPAFLFRNPEQKPCYHIRKALEEIGISIKGGDSDGKKNQRVKD